MSCGLVCTNLGIKPGQRFGVKGEITPGAKSFVVNIGKDPANIVLHFNARFDIHGDVKTIVCNSKNNGEWGTELRETTFPFQEGSTVEIFFVHDKNELTVQLPGHQFKFPNRLGLQAIDYLSEEGDFKLKSLQME
ncbi:PREDICTED: galectin-1 [Gavialis gangeticus]|uniref:galectin-1 n=1 Tax=Gavialis gangeticus TaxID=94835 RepID=UPI00092F398B|nr:PREDICTED: galectin-1 [Gavialis gangeticus]